MTGLIPDPPLPPDVDLRDFGFMPLHVMRLRDSDMAALSTGDEFKAAVLLWAYSWHQVPAASLPNDDRILAARSGAGPNWRKVKQQALAGFVECSDGRLYHSVIAEVALEAWGRRDQHQAKVESRESRQQRWRADCKRLCDLLRSAGVTPPAKPTKAQLVDMCKKHVDGFVDADVDGRVDAGETRRDAGEMRKTETETGIKTENQERGTSTDVGAPAPPEPDLSSHTPTPAGLACKAMRAAGLASVNPSDPRLIALLQQGVTTEELQGIAAEALTKSPPKGFAWVLATARGRREEAAAITLPQQAAAAPTDPNAWETDRKAVDRRAAAVGLEPWDAGAAACGRGPSLAVYVARIKAREAKEPA